MFEFALTPIDEVQPWGRPPDLELPWIGLSYGSYHLDLGTARLLEYMPLPGWPRYVEYQLSHFHQNLLNRLPEVLDPVPDDIARRLRETSVRKLVEALEIEWSAAEEADAGRETLDRTIETFQHRHLDSMYLSCPFLVWMWRDGDCIVFDWDNRGVLFEGKAVWTAEAGRWEVPVPRFLEEVSAFHARLMSEMRHRVEIVANGGWGRPDVKVDAEGLRSQQRLRERFLESALRRPTAGNWEAVRIELSRLGEKGC